jgi:hypothetical protein
MKTKIIVFVLGGVLIFTHGAESGAAVAKAKQPKQTRPQQLPPGYVMGPHGVQKIAQIAEHESLAEEAAEGGQEEAVEVKDEVDLNQIVEVLQSSSQAWELIISQQDKEIVAQAFIDRYRQQGVTIQKPAGYYANFIDEMSKNSPEMLAMPFDRVLQVVAVMEYDFDNGQNKDALAQKILGQSFYEKNKQRFMKSNAQGQSGH